MNFSLSPDRRSVRLEGPLDERTDLAPLAGELDGEVHVDASRITRINSSGVKQWLLFIRQLRPSVRLVFEKCPVAFVTQLNVVQGFVGDASIASVAVPFLCPACGETFEPIFPVAELGAGRGPTSPPCVKCGAATELDVPADEYFAFLGPS